MVAEELEGTKFRGKLFLCRVVDIVDDPKVQPKSRAEMTKYG
jgi:hypothetical protein